MTKPKTGVQEWAKHSFNYQVGCENDCKYCYAKRNALRFGLIKSDKEWAKPRLNLPKTSQNLQCRKVKGTIMFPTMHDLNNIDEACRRLGALGTEYNNVLIVSKAKPLYIARIYQEVGKIGMPGIEFRITIGSTNNMLLEYWEPNAPLFEERLAALQLAFELGFKTSVSMEPMLELPCDVIEHTLQYCTEGVWLGFMNKHKDAPIPSLEYLVDLQNDYGADKIHFKDSITSALKRKDIA